MRTKGIFVLLLFVFVAISHSGTIPRAAGALVPHRGPAETLPVPGSNAAWQYTEGEPFHAVLPRAVQGYRSQDPEATASRVCNALGGDIAYLEPPKPADPTVGFLCRFQEPDVTMAVNFGDLRLISQK